MTKETLITYTSTNEELKDFWEFLFRLYPGETKITEIFKTKK